MTREWVWLDRAVILAIHDMQLAEHGGGAGVRDAGLLDSALGKPLQLEAYGDPPPDAAALAASYGYGISRNHPFIELPDLLVQAPPKLNGAGVSAINVGARLGVVGQPLTVPVLRAERYALLDALRDMQVTVTDAPGTVLGQGKGSDILEHPLNAVVWLAQALQQEGITLQPGDLISLGSFSPLLPPKPGQTITVTYTGLPGAQPVRVSFR